MDFRRQPAASFVATLLAALLVQGCTELKVRAGQRPDVSVLETQLRANESTREDVRWILGPPFGQGAAMLPFHDAPREMWSYYYEEGTLTDDRRIMLLVYFSKDGHYEGYMWFSSLPPAAPAVKQTKAADVRAPP